MIQLLQFKALSFRISYVAGNIMDGLFSLIVAFTVIRRLLVNDITKRKRYTYSFTFTSIP